MFIEALFKMKKETGQNLNSHQKGNIWKKQNSHTRKYYIGLVVRCQLWCLHPTSEYMGSTPSSRSWFQFPANSDPRRQWWWFKQPGSCHPCGRTELSSQSPCYHEYLGNEPPDGSTLSFCVPQMNEWECLMAWFQITGWVTMGYYMEIEKIMWYNLILR